MPKAEVLICQVRFPYERIVTQMLSQKPHRVGNIIGIKSVYSSNSNHGLQSANRMTYN